MEKMLKKMLISTLLKRFFSKPKQKLMTLNVPTEFDTSIDKHRFIINTLSFLEHNTKIVNNE